MKWSIQDSLHGRRPGINHTQDAGDCSRQARAGIAADKREQGDII